MPLPRPAPSWTTTSWPGGDQRVDAGRDHPDPVLVVLDFLRDSDPHGHAFPGSSSRGSSVALRFASWPCRPSSPPCPLKKAPSAMTTRGAAISPSRLPEGATSTRSEAVHVPDHPAADAHDLGADRALAPAPRLPTIDRGLDPDLALDLALDRAARSGPVISPWTREPGAMWVMRRCCGFGEAKFRVGGRGGRCRGSGWRIATEDRHSSFRAFQPRAAPDGGPDALTGSEGKEIGAGNGTRTRDIKLGKLALYQLSYARSMLRARGNLADRACPGSRGCRGRLPSPCQTRYTQRHARLRQSRKRLDRQESLYFFPDQRVTAEELRHLLAPRHRPRSAPG